MNSLEYLDFIDVFNRLFRCEKISNSDRLKISMFTAYQEFYKSQNTTVIIDVEVEAYFDVRHFDVPGMPGSAEQCRLKPREFLAAGTKVRVRNIKISEHQKLP